MVVRNGIVEKSHYSHSTIELETMLPREEFIRIADEIVPMDERGRPANDLEGDYLSLSSGSSVTTFREYENLSIRIYGRASTGLLKRRGQLTACLKTTVHKSDSFSPNGSA